MSNLFVCLSGLTHPNGLLGLLVLVFLILYLDRKRIGVGMVVIGIVPYALGAVGWGVYIMQDVAAFKAQFFHNVARTDAFGWSSALVELRMYWTNYGTYRESLLSHYFQGVHRFAPVLAFFFLGLIAAPFVVKRRLLIWFMLLILLLGMTFLIGHKDAEWYLAWITPFFLLNSVMIWDVLKRAKLAKVFFSLAYCYIILLSVYWSVIGIKADAYQNSMYDLNRFQSQYYQGGKIDGVLNGGIAFFYDFHDDVYQDVVGWPSDIAPRYFVLSNGWPGDPSAQTLSDNGYTKIFEGKVYTFYEKTQ